MKLTKTALILILSPFVFLTGCSTIPVEQTINPNDLPPESLATVIGYEDFHSTRSSISNAKKGDGEKLFEQDQSLRKLTLEPGTYTLDTYCRTALGAYAEPSIQVNLEANKTYRIECGYCVAKGQKNWWSFMKSGSPRVLAVVDWVPVPDITTANFEEILNAAKAGYGQARIAVANAYYDGTYPQEKEVNNNLHEAYAWASLADVQREPDADVLLSKITAEIDDLDAAESLANKYLLHYWAPQSNLCSKPMIGDSNLAENLEAKTENRKIKVLLYSDNSSFLEIVTVPIEIKINDIFVKNLLLNEYVEVFLSPGTHNLHLSAYYHALSTYKDSYDLKVGEKAIIIKLKSGLASTKYEIVDELPANFREEYIRAKM